MRRIFVVVLLAAAVPASSIGTVRSARPAPGPLPSLRPGLNAGLASPVPLSPPLSLVSLSAPSLSAAAPAPLAAAPVVAAPDAGEFTVAAEAPSSDPKTLAVQTFVAREVAGWDLRAVPADAPVAPLEPSRPSGRSRLAKAALWTGVGALGLSALGSAPVLAPAVLGAAKGWLAAGGFSALLTSRYLGPAADKSAVVPVPPAPAPVDSRFAEYRTGWRAVEHALDVQQVFEKRVGDADRSTFSTYFSGGLRAGFYASGAALLAMLAGGAVAKALSLTTASAAAVAAPAASSAAIAAAPFWGQFGAFVAPALVLETLLLKVVFDGGRAVLGKVLSPRAASVVAGGLAAAGSVAAMSLLTTQFSVLLPIAGLEVAVVWAYARSGSLLAALAARGLLTVLALESARVGAWLAYGTAGTLAGLPAWTGAAVAGLLILGYIFVAKKLGRAAALAAPGRALSALGDWWRAPADDGRPKSFFPVLKSGLLWGLITYAVGDLAYRAVLFISPVAEAAAPDILLKVLTGPLDLLLFNFVIVGFLEEFVFRRNLFKPMRNWIEKRGLSPRVVFWTAALASSLIFSYVHYIDFAAILAKLGIGVGGAAGVAGAYNWAWASFTARAAAGVVLAYQYWRSGLLLVPIVAHFAANTMEGLGLRWGVEAFLLLSAGALLLQLLGRQPNIKRS